MENPYKSISARAFWKRAVSMNWAAEDLITGDSLIRKGEKVASAGSCFAANIVPFLEKAGFDYVRTEQYPTAFGRFTEDNFSYSKFSAAYGNIYTARQAAQLLLRALGRFRPAEDRWVSEECVIDPFRPGLRYPAMSEAEFDLITAQHLRKTLEALRAADVFVFTLGLTEAWLSRADGAVYPACPGTVAGTFDPQKHVFENFTVADVSQDLDDLVSLCHEVNPRLRIILTVSPVPLVATATQDHVLVATMYSKSVLRAAAGEVVQRHTEVTYFPAYEIVTGPQAPFEFFEDDRREPSALAIRTVMGSFLSRCETSFQLPVEIFQERSLAPKLMSLEHKSQASEQTREHGAQMLSMKIADALCEEAAADT